MPPTFAYAPAPVPAQGPASMPQEELQTEAPPAANPGMFRGESSKQQALMASHASHKSIMLALRPRLGGGLRLFPIT